LFWIKYHGENQKFSRILPHQSLTQSTFVGHVWLLRDDSGKCVAVFRAALPRAVIGGSPSH
jgi:hypothetical protein